MDGEALDPTWDAFSLAVILYQLLTGVHPFAVRAFDPATGMMVQTVRDAIAAGLYAHAPARASGPQMQCAPPHAAAAKLPAALREAFDRAFVDGHVDPARRPSVEEWATLLPTATGWRPEVLALRRWAAMRGAVLQVQTRTARDFVQASLHRVRARMRERREANRRVLREGWTQRRFRIGEYVTLRDLFCVQLGAMATLLWVVWMSGGSGAHGH